MKNFKCLIFSIISLGVLSVSLFAAPQLEDMAIDSEYVGVVKITKVQTATIALTKFGDNKKKEDNVSRYTLEILETIKGGESC